MTWPLPMAPEVPKDRVEALRQAMARVAAHTEFQAESEKAKLGVVFSTAQQVEARVKHGRGMPLPWWTSSMRCARARESARSPRRSIPSPVGTLPLFRDGP